MEDFKNLPKPLKLTDLQKEYEFYKSHFSILQKQFRNVCDRLRSEAFYIRMFRRIQNASDLNLFLSKEINRIEKNILAPKN